MQKLSPYPCGNLDHHHHLLDALPVLVADALPILPKFYGNTLQVLFGLTQHAGLYEDIKDHRYSTRTVYLNPVFSFLYWQMEYHIEHHMFPNVPSHNLPKLHQMLQDQMPPAKKGLWEAYREIVPAVIRQAKNPDYKIPLSVPQT